MKKIIIFSFVLVIFLSFSNKVLSQWQSCGTYTGNVLPFAVIDSVLIAGTYGDGVYYTTDGVNWTYSNNGMTNAQLTCLTVSGNNVFAGSESGGVYRSSDNGATWTPVNNGLVNLTIHTLCSNSGSVFAGTSSGVHITTDNGDNWTKISTSSIGNVIYSLTSYDNKIISTSGSGVFITTNGGQDWTNITNGIVSNIYCLTRFNGTVYAGSSSQGVYKTTNDGSDWIQINSGLPSSKAVRTIYCETDKIYAAVYNSGGIYYLPTSGSTWLPANEGLTQPTCYTVTSYKNYIYAGTYSGIFRRPKSEFTSVQKTNEITPGEFKLYNNYPNPFNSETVIKFSVPKSSNFPVRLELYDITGRLIKVLVNNLLSSGVYEVKYNAGNLASGSYIIRLSNSNHVVTSKITLIK